MVQMTSSSRRGAPQEEAEAVSQKRDNKAVRDFAAMKTRAKRNAIEDGDFYFLENIMPIGPANLQSVPGPGPNLATITGTTFAKMFGVNIGAPTVPWLLGFGANGQLWAFNTNTNVITSVAPSGSFQTNATGVDLTVWQGATVLMIDSIKGYFQWPMTTPGAATVAIGAAGNVNAGTHSWWVSFVNAYGESTVGTKSAQLNLGVASIVNLTAIPLGPTGTTQRKIYRTIAGDTGNPLFVGTIADNTTTTFNDNVADSGLGAAAPTVGAIQLITTTGLTNILGTTLSVFAGKAWVASNRTIQHSAPNSFTDFTTANGGGSFVMTDSAFIGNVQKLLGSLDVLWIFGEAAVNQISNVQFTTTTTFSNVNISSSVGTTFYLSVQSFLRQLMYATAYGVYKQIGVSSNRVSEAVDDTFSQIVLTTALEGAVFTLNQILCYGALATWTDPDTGTNRPVILVFFDDKWFLGSQGNGLTHIASIESQGTYKVYGTTGSNIFQLFATPGYSVHKLKTPLFDLGDDTTGKEMVRAQVTFFTTVFPTLTLTPQTERGAGRIEKGTYSAAIVWIGQGGSVLQFTGLGAALLNFVGTGFLFAKWTTSNFGKMVGFDLSLDSDPFTITSYGFDHILRESW